MNLPNWRQSLLTFIFLIPVTLNAADEQGKHQDSHDHVEVVDSHHKPGHEEKDHADHTDHEEHAEDDHKDDEHGHNEQKAHTEDSHMDEDKDEHGHEGEEEESGIVELNNDQQKAAGIKVIKLESRVMPIEALALGEIKLNSYATSQTSPRIQGQVVKRHARLGDRVKKGQPLVTLSSVAMAEAQGDAFIAAKEWQRVSKLGKKVVSERRYVEAQIAYQQAHARLLAYGMNAQQADNLISSNDIAGADGRYTLNALQNGVVIRDDFILGQMAEPGQLIFEITNESKLWVDAQVNPESINGLKVGASARVQVGDKWIGAKVIQIHNSLDEVTRTLVVRLEIDNSKKQFRPGQFVTASIDVGVENRAVTALPMNAVLRSPDGDWQVFIEEEPGRFEGREVEVVRQVSGQAVIEGLPVGISVVTEGAFFVQSEQAKSGFDVHNH